MEDGLLSAEQFSTTTLRRVLDPSWKLLAPALLIALAFVLAAAGRRYAHGGGRKLLQRRIACSERDIPTGPGDLQALPNPLAHRPS
jgi:hypothetical protein